jgi:hypothetical protein
MDAHSLALSPSYPNVHIRVYTTQYLDPRDVQSGFETFFLPCPAVEMMNSWLHECCLAVVDVSSAHANSVSWAYVLRMQPDITEGAKGDDYI